LDFWGRFRREIESADANLCAELAGYDDVLVILQAEVAATYVEIRTLARRLELANENLRLQKDTLAIVESGFRGGIYPAVDMEQAKATAAITEAAIPLLEIRYRQAQNRLCVLLGMPPQDIEQILGGPRPIPTAPAEVVVGIPAELLRRRPDIRRAEREVEAESARIGVAISELYPHFSITGNIGLAAAEFQQMFNPNSITGSIGPNFRWNILNYGRIQGTIDTQDARFRQSVINYQQTVLAANEDVENGMIAFLREKKRLQPLGEAVTALEKAYDLSLTSYKAGILDFQRVLDSQRALVLEQDHLAEGQGNVSLYLISVYKALGGGWRVRCPGVQGEFDPFNTTGIGEDPLLEDEQPTLAGENPPVPSEDSVILGGNPVILGENPLEADERTR
jgi:NodT family efflux transporter outer membrane factor (OMF) lipoprotein